MKIIVQNWKINYNKTKKSKIVYWWIWMNYLKLIIKNFKNLSKNNKNNWLIKINNITNQICNKQIILYLKNNNKLIIFLLVIKKDNKWIDNLLKLHVLMFL